MVLCHPTNCIPCCDFCIFSIRDIQEVFNGLTIDCGPMGCKLHPEQNYQEMAQCCEFCEDFHCFNVKEET